MQTVSEKYIAVSGIPEPTDGHARCIAMLSLEMMTAVRQLNAKLSQQMMAAVREGQLNATRETAVSVPAMPSSCHICIYRTRL